MEPWRRIKSSYIVDDQWLHLRADSCETERGTVVEPYYVIEAPNWVNIVALTEQHEVLFVQQYRHAIARIVIELPCGVQEESDASPEATIRRELREETGHTVRQLHLIGCFDVNPARFANRVYSYLGLGARPDGRVPPDESESLEVKFKSLHTVAEDLDKGLLDLQPMHLVGLYRALAWIRTNDPALLSFTERF